MDTLANHIRDYEKAGNNVFTRSQARHLDKYLYRARQPVKSALMISIFANQLPAAVSPISKK